MKILAVLAFWLVAQTAWAQAVPAGQAVTFQGPHGPLGGYLFRPQGAGPFPAVLWNHGSEPEPGDQPELARFYTEHGFIFFIPHRSGQGLSPGAYSRDAVRRGASPIMVVREHEAANLDVTAALEWLRAQPDVDPARLVVSGCSYGGIQTLLTAEKGLGVRAFVAFAPAAQSWRNGTLRDRLAGAVEQAKAPLFILQARNDYSLGPSELLGPLVLAHGGKVQVYPSFGRATQDGHWAFATTKAGIDVWGDEVLAFIDRAFQGGAPATGR